MPKINLDSIKTAFAENRGLIIQKVSVVAGAALGLVVAAILVNSESYEDDVLVAEEVDILD